MRRTLVALVSAAAALTGTLIAAPNATAHRHCASPSWPMYGHDLRHTFAVAPGCSGITRSNVATLVPAWFFHAKDSVTASPAVSHGSLYVGSWDGTFYALNATTGALEWKYQIKAAAPSAFGRIVSSATVVTAGRGAHRRRVVIFGGGSSVWVLDAVTGKKLASINLDPRTKADRKSDQADPRVVEVESSPAVIPAGRGRKHIYVGMDVHDEPQVGQTGLVALTLSGGNRWHLRPWWKYDVETGKVLHGRAGLTKGSGHGLGCGGIWSSPAISPSHRLVLIGTASCDYAATAYARHINYSEEMVALRARTGRPVWSYRPENSLPKAQRVPAAEDDADFGASPNLFRLHGGRWAVGDGSKSAKYYVRTLHHGRKVTTTLAGQNGLLESNFAVGGFIGSPGVELNSHGVAKRVIGGTAIPLPKSVAGINRATWDVRGLNPNTGKVNWVFRLGAPTYGATSIVNGVAFVPLTLQSDVVALNTDNGHLLWVGPVFGPPSSTAVVVGDSVYVATGTRETDLEYKAVSDQLQNILKQYLGESPLSPISGIQAFRLASALGK